VFDGSIGNYDEESDTTGIDAYGKTKALGEIRYPHSLTIRSSFIGRELDGKTELLEWFLAQENQTIRGFTKAFYSGVSTTEMCRVVGDIIESHPDLGGLYTLAMPEPISKYDLLCIARDAFDMNVTIQADDSFEIKPTLNGDKLRQAIGVQLPSWPVMMKQIANDPLYQA
jgi:dTDP-4-dehydrorhamnose reductase